MENDHHVLTQRLRDFCLSNPQTLASRDHQNDGDDPPRDPEHGQKCSQLVRPKCAEHIANEVAENHSAFLDGTAIRRSSSGAQMDRDARLAIGTHSGGELLQKSSWQSRPQFPEWLSRLRLARQARCLDKDARSLPPGKHVSRDGNRRVTLGLKEPIQSETMRQLFSVPLGLCGEQETKPPLRRRAPPTDRTPAKRPRIVNDASPVGPVHVSPRVATNRT